MLLQLYYIDKQSVAPVYAGPVVIPQEQQFHDGPRMSFEMI